MKKYTKILLSIYFALFSINISNANEVKSLLDDYKYGFYDIIKNLQIERNIIYQNCIKNSASCAHIFTADITYSLDQAGIGYFSEASFPARLKFPSDDGINDRDLNINIFYACRVFVKEKTSGKSVAIYLPNATYYTFFNDNVIVNIESGSKNTRFDFQKIYNDNSLFFLLADDQIDEFLNILNTENALLLKTDDNRLVSKINFLKVKNEKKIFDDFCNIN